MNYELSKELKEAGFPRQIVWQCLKGRDGIHNCRADKTDCKIQVLSTPTLSELIEACGERFMLLYKNDDASGWTAFKSGDLLSDKNLADGPTPTDAVAKLWLALNKHD